MAFAKKINELKINDHVWIFTDPQIVEWKQTEDGFEMKANLRILAEFKMKNHEEGIKPKQISDEE